MAVLHCRRELWCPNFITMSSVLNADGRAGVYQYIEMLNCKTLLLCCTPDLNFYASILLIHACIHWSELQCFQSHDKVLLSHDLARTAESRFTWLFHPTLLSSMFRLCSCFAPYAAWYSTVGRTALKHQYITIVCMATKYSKQYKHWSYCLVLTV